MLCSFPNLDFKSALFNLFAKAALKLSCPLKEKRNCPVLISVRRAPALSGAWGQLPLLNRPGILNDRVPPGPVCLGHLTCFSPHRRKGGSTTASYSWFSPSRLCHGNVHASSRQRPSSAQGLRAFGTLRERAAHSGLPGKQLDATTSRVGAGRRRSAPARPRPPRSPAPSPRRGLRVAFGKTQPWNI